MLRRGQLGSDAQRKVTEETLRILGRCAPPDWVERQGEAELVVGAVQSGKTLSFTALVAAARDNGYPLVIVLAGTKKNLRNQTYQRLYRDLAMNGDGGIPSWRPTDTPDAAAAVGLIPHLDRWRRSGGRGHPLTTVAVVMKNKAGLDRARDFLATITAKVGAVPTLFVDDEADQAGLNLAARRGEESSTYRYIRRLRSASPNHSYVLYTATPQAPLLISLSDALSPRTVTVLEPGDGYVDGQALFVERRAAFVRLIEDDRALDPESVAPPDSLEQALATFLLAMLVAQMRGTPKPLSMLVHPSQGRNLHSTYEAWVHAIVARVRTVLLDGDPVLLMQLRDEMFAGPYEDLAATDGVVVDGRAVPLDELVDHLENYLDHVEVRVVNSEDGHEIDPGEWLQRSGWIVIGGNKLDRGFTVENLAITFMPRGPGMKNADTVQQRGRFFGYKASYLDLLRGWFSSQTVDVYTAYVAHERAMRDDLAELDATGATLSEWRRSILLDADLNPTRRQVITLENESHLLKPGWAVTQDRLYVDEVGPTAEAKITLAAMLSQSRRDPRDRRTGGPANTVLRVSWSDVATVLAAWRGARADQDALYAVMLALRGASEDLPVDVVFMNGGERRQRGPAPDSARELERCGWDPARTADPEALRIANLMQGADPDDGSRYIGDRRFLAKDAVTLQIHHVAVSSGDSRRAVTALALGLPEGVRERVILQR